MWVKLARLGCANTHTSVGSCCPLSVQSVLSAATLLVAATCLGGLARADAPAPRVGSCAGCPCATARAPSQCAAESSDFVVRTFVGGPAAADVVRYCDLVCTRLRSEVFALEPAAPWQLKCRVILHATRQDYRDALGSSAAQTVGSSTIRLSGGRVIERRIDLLAVNAEQGLSALPHELVHVLCVDAFPAQAPPKWAEEGLALLMDPVDKQARHRHDLETAIRNHSTLPLARLLSSADYPAAQWAAFYAQSLTLVDYLTRRNSPQEFVRFVRLSQEIGQDRALQSVYQLHRDDLEKCWLQRDTQRQLAGAPVR